MRCHLKLFYHQIDFDKCNYNIKANSFLLNNQENIEDFA